MSKCIVCKKETGNKIKNKNVFCSTVCYRKKNPNTKSIVNSIVGNNNVIYGNVTFGK